MADGSCASPVPPCVPVRSQRAARGQVVRWSVVATIALLAILLGVEGRALLMPGPLIQAHASLGDCRSCHAAVPDGPVQWLHAVFAAPSGADDSGKCLGCHKGSATPLKPHGLDPERLAALEHAALQRFAAGLAPHATLGEKAVFSVAAPAAGAFACAACHTEHRGDKADLTAISETRCQSCHAVQFASFTAGHPEFHAYPYQRRTRIVFDHVAHFMRHFPEAAGKPGAAPPGLCADCHLPDANGQRMETRSFAETCSACHANQIVGADRAIGPRGMPFLAVPGLDVRTLAEHDIAIGAWPEASEARLTPFMTLLLGGDPKVREAMAATAKLDLLDLRKASDAQLDAVATMAWAVKQLFSDLAVFGHARLRERLAAATGRAPDDALLGWMFGSLPRDTLIGAQRDWFPDLARELDDRAAGRAIAIPLRRPAAAAAPAATPSAAAKDTGDILADEPAKDTGDILSDDAAKTPPPAAKDTGDILADEPAKDTGDILTGDTAQAAAPPTPAAPAAPKPASVNEEDYARLGGWYRQDFQILFHPTGHADRFLRGWLDFSGGAMGSPGRADVAPIFALLSGKDAQGQCVKCHAVERAADGGLALKWHPQSGGGAISALTKFAHAPHLGIAPDQGCATCHKLDPAAKYLESFAGFDPHSFAGNFQPMERDTCVGCHTTANAGQSCLLCHTYHETPLVAPTIATKLTDSLPPAKPQ
jgi:hypothetical protein